MRISCQVSVQSYDSVRPTKGHASKCYLTIGPKPGLRGHSSLLMVSSASNREGNIYTVHNNVKQIFAKFIHLGQATIRLQEPKTDFIISKADVVPLKAFLHTLMAVHKGDQSIPTSRLTTLRPVASKDAEKLRTKISIKCRSDYPTIQGFPPGLTQLHTNNCLLRKFDNRIFHLKRLVTLHLSQNSIEHIPEAISSLCSLSILHLGNNKLREISESVCFALSNCSKLTLLNICHNEIERLPLNIHLLSNLRYLYAEGNKLKTLPPMLGYMKTLQCLKVDSNEIQILPATLSKLRLSDLDLANNKFPEVMITRGTRTGGRGRMSLLNLAAQAANKLKIEPGALPTMLYCKMLMPYVCCCCSNITVNPVGTGMHHFPLAELLKDGMTSQENFPGLVGFCSEACFTMYDNGSMAELARLKRIRGA